MKRWQHLILGLCSAASVNSLANDAPLTENPGDVRRGQAAVEDRQRGHCLLCHQIQQLDARSQGNLGPDLSQVGSRLNAAQLRQRIVDSSRLNPDTIMPPYHRTTNLNQVAKRYRGQPVLNAQEVEDVVAYLMTLRGSP